MKHNYVFTLFVVMIFNSGTGSLLAQAYHPMPEGAVRWDISRCWYFYPGGWHDKYYVEMDGSDTMMYGKTYKKLFHTTHHLPGTEFDSTYTHFLGGMREENRQVFMVSSYLCLDTIERMIYDFKPVAAGDTLRTQILTNGLVDAIPQIVTSVDEVMVDGSPRRRIQMRDEQGIFTDAWVEGIGSMRGLPYAMYWMLTDNSYDLQCYYEEGQLRYINENPAFDFCTPPFPKGECAPVITSSVEDPQDVQIVIYPNPADAIVYISGTAELSSIEIFNTLGKRISQSRFTGQVRLDHLAAGMYLLRLYDTSGIALPVKRLIKQ